MGNPEGSFSVVLAFEIMRRKRAKVEDVNNIWVNGLPFKIGFFLWRVRRRRIPIDDNLK